MRRARAVAEAATRRVIARAGGGATRGAREGGMMDSSGTRAGGRVLDAVRPGVVCEASRAVRMASSDAGMALLRRMSDEERRAVAEAVVREAETRRVVVRALVASGDAARAFDELDANEDGVVDRKEFMMALSRDESRGSGGGGGATLTAAELRAVALSSAVPFVGFGLCDNAVMILAGESIETALGVGLGLSTMASAACGNTVSDVVGIGLSSKIESFAETMGFASPPLTREQRRSAAVRWAKVAGATSGVTLGCFLGMFPLLL